MNIVYFSHSYRKEDTAIVTYFGRLLRSEGVLPSLDPPSKTVNSAKLERHLNSSDGMVAIVTWRIGGVSEHILYEINLCLRSRKPLLVFIEDVLEDNIAPSRILQRRFSRKSFLRGVREHRHGINILKNYLGTNPPPLYQPSTLKRSCLIIGVQPFIKNETLVRIVENLNYKAVIINDNSIANKNAIMELMFSADISLNFLDKLTIKSNYLLGMTHSLSIPSISFTMKKDYSYNTKIPREYQPQFLNSQEEDEINKLIRTEFNTFEEDFVELDNQEEVETYTSLLVDISDQRGNYEAGTRNYIINNMRDQFNVNKAGIVGQEVSKNTVTLNETVTDFQKDINLIDLAKELAILRQAMRDASTDADHDIALSDVAKAEQAAKRNDPSKVIKYLKSAGSWALEVATKIGVSLATEALKKAI